MSCSGCFDVSLQLFRAFQLQSLPLILGLAGLGGGLYFAKELGFGGLGTGEKAAVAAKVCARDGDARPGVPDGLGWACRGLGPGFRWVTHWVMRGSLPRVEAWLTMSIDAPRPSDAVLSFTC